ncbi:MAG: thiopurine S-methyltransferase [Alphaproteobacteria bacterium]
MDAEFWHGKWAKKEIGFHEGKPNRLLAAHVGRLGLAPGARVFLPLCGKTADVGWLMKQGYRVAGIELSSTAIADLFVDLGLTPRVSKAGLLTRYQQDGVDILCGDIFDLDASTLGPVDAIYDRAALVALPAGTRSRYASHLYQIASGAPQLLIAFDYDQTAMDGPPFSVPENAVRTLYGDAYGIQRIVSTPVPGGLKGTVDAREEAFLLRA